MYGKRQLSLTSLVVLSLLIGGQAAGQSPDAEAGSKPQGWPMPNMTVKNDRVFPVPSEVGARARGYRRTNRLEGDARWSGMLIGHLQEGAGLQCVVSSGDSLVIINPEMTPGGRIDGLPPKHALSLLADINGDGFDEIFFSWTEGDRLRIRAINGEGRTVQEFETKGRIYRGKPDSGITASCISDIDGDGELELLARVSSGYGQQPRGVYCFDVRTGRNLWAFPTGPAVKHICVADIDGDRKNEVIFGSYSPGNGARSNGTDDMHCYVFCIDHHGSRKWIREVGGHFTGAEVTVVDIDGDKRADIVARLEAGPDFREEVGAVIRLSSDGQVVASYDCAATAYSLAAVPRGEGEAGRRLLVTDRRGLVHVLSPDLKLAAKKMIGRSAYESYVARIVAAADLTGNGKYELVLEVGERQFVRGRNPRSDRGLRNVRVWHRNGVMVLNHRLKALDFKLVADKWVKHPGFRARVVDLDGDGLLDILTCAEDFRSYETSEKRERKCQSLPGNVSSGPRRRTGR